jgi:hypothetical protein
LAFIDLLPFIVVLPFIILVTVSDAYVGICRHLISVNRHRKALHCHTGSSISVSAFGGVNDIGVRHTSASNTERSQGPTQSKELKSSSQRLFILIEPTIF